MFIFNFIFAFQFFSKFFFLFKFMFFHSFSSIMQNDTAIIIAIIIFYLFISTLLLFDLNFLKYFGSRSVIDFVKFRKKIVLCWSIRWLSAKYIRIVTIQIHFPGCC